jgi:hypothetical protein
MWNPAISSLGNLFLPPAIDNFEMFFRPVIINQIRISKILKILFLNIILLIIDGSLTGCSHCPPPTAPTAPSLNLPLIPDHQPLLHTLINADILPTTIRKPRLPDIQQLLAPSRQEVVAVAAEDCLVGGRVEGVG